MVGALIAAGRAWQEFRQPISRWWGLRVEAALEGLYRLTLNAPAIQARRERLRELVAMRPLLQRIVRNPPRRDQSGPSFELEGMKVQALLDLRRLGIETFVDDAQQDDNTREALVRFFNRLIVACDRRSLRLAARAWHDTKRDAKE